jgi:uncharacterized phage protein gp47/JayE
MPTYGLTDEGFLAKPLEVILEEINAYQKANIHPNWDTSAGSSIGQVNASHANQVAAGWEALAACYDMMDPDNATNERLTSLASLTGTLRRDAQAALVICDVNLDAGTYLARTLVASKAGDPDARVVNLYDIAAPGGALTDQVFVAETPGEFEAGTGTITVIAEPVAGWNSVVSTSPASGGTGIETDPTLRTRREAELEASGTETLAAIKAAVSELDNVITVKGLENVSNITDENGVPAHAFEILVWDASIADDDEIAQAIWDNHPAGIASYGSESGEATDDEGATHTVYFSRMDTRRVYLDIDLTEEDEGYVGGAAVKTAIEEWALENYGSGDDVVLSKIAAVVSLLTGVYDVTEVRASFSPSPTLTANLTIGVREIATVDAADIDVTSV